MGLTFLYTLELETYVEDVTKLLNTILKTLKKVCYISLNKTGDSVLTFCKEQGIDIERVEVIDMISSRFSKPMNKPHISYVDINDPGKIIQDVTKIIQKTGCEGIVFDSLSALEIYFSSKNMLPFVHELLVYAESEHLITNMIIQKKDVDKDWVKTLIPLLGQPRPVHFNLQ